jgi:hypothetical protein
LVGLAGRIAGVFVLAGGLFGAIWNTVDDVRDQLPPAMIQPSPTVEPERTAETPDDFGCEETVYTVRLSPAAGSALTRADGASG